MERAHQMVTGVVFCDNAYQVADGAEALVLVTDWNQFKQLDMARIKAAMASPLLIDGRNIYDPEQMRPPRLRLRRRRPQPGCRAWLTATQFRLGGGRDRVLTVRIEWPGRAARPVDTSGGATDRGGEADC